MYYQLKVLIKSIFSVFSNGLGSLANQMSPLSQLLPKKLISNLTDSSQTKIAFVKCSHSLLQWSNPTTDVLASRPTTNKRGKL